MARGPIESTLMSQFLLRVEGVNLVNVIDDTDDLSTRRGGGLMILNAAAQLPKTLPKETRDRLTPIATSASIGLFSFEAADENDAEAIRAAVESHFRTGTLVDPETPTVTGHLHLKHGTFVVDVEPMGQSPAEANQMVLARNRCAQHALSEPVPGRVVVGRSDRSLRVRLRSARLTDCECRR